MRGSIKSLFGSAEHGVLVEGHDGKILRAFFDEWANPGEAIAEDPLLSARAKQAVTRDMETNPRIPDWRCQGFISQIREDRSGVFLIRYDGTERFIPFARAS